MNKKIILVLALVMVLSTPMTAGARPIRISKSGLGAGISNTVINPGKVEYSEGGSVGLNSQWQYAGNSLINSGYAVMYKAAENRKDIVIAVNAGHGTKGGTAVKTYCHPDQSPKTTGGSTAQGAVTAAAVSSGMTMNDGNSEASVTLRQAQIFRDALLMAGYDVLMLRDGEDVQLDNVARTVIANNVADCHISIHWDGDGLATDKGAFFISVPDGIKNMPPVSSNWERCDALGSVLVEGLANHGCKIYSKGRMSVDLTQTSYSTIPSVDLELGNQSSVHDDATLTRNAMGMVEGVNKYFGL